MVADAPLNTGRAMRDAIASDSVRLEDYDVMVGTDARASPVPEAAGPARGWAAAVIAVHPYA